MPSIIEAVTDALQERLTNPNKPWAKRLADLLVANALSTPLQKLVPLDDALEAVRNGLIDYVRSESSLESFSRVVDGQLELLKTYNAPLSELLPPQFVRALRQQALRPWSPGSRSLLKALDHEPVRGLISRIVVQAVVDFSTAGRSSTRKKARQGLDAVLGSVGQELGDKLQQKAEAFAQKAVSGVLGIVVDELSDPKRAKQQAALRASILSGVLSIEADNLAEELDKLDLSGCADLFRQSLGAWLESKEGQRVFTRWLRGLLEPVWSRRFGDVIAQHGLDRVAKRQLPRIVEARVRAFAESDEFRRFVKDVGTD